MTLRWQDISRIGVLGWLALAACSNSSPDTNGSAGGSGGAGTSGSTGATTAGTSAQGGSGGAGGSQSGGSFTEGGLVSGGSAGTSAGSGGASGSAGTSAGSGGTASGTGGTLGGSGGSGGGASGNGGGGGGKSKTTFFVTSDTNMTGKLGGLDGADARCQALAVKANIGDHTFHAYLSTATVNAKDRIGAGPWVNSKGLTVAASVAALHDPAMKGDHTIFIDEKGADIHGQWDASGMVQHDILTGSKPDGTVQTGLTCSDWTSDSAQMTAQVGHSDGMGPGMATTGTYTSWNSSHANGSCADTAPKGGAGRLYCFATN